MVNNPPESKQHDLAIVFSEKKMRMTLHRKRFNFMKEMEREFPQMHVYGRSKDHIALDDKTDALVPYRYSFAIENHLEKHHWTEKLADAFLGLTLPFMQVVQMQQIISQRKALFKLILMMLLVL